MLIPIQLSQVQSGAISTLWREEVQSHGDSATQEEQPDTGPLVSMSDEQLLALHLAGCPESFGILVDRHRRDCLITALGVLGNLASAEDEVQTAFLKAYVAANTFNGQAKFIPWMRQIVVNQCRMRLRLERRRRTDVCEERISHAQCHRKSQEEVFAAQQVIDLVRKEILRLPAPLRDVLRSVLIEDRTPRECSIHLGLTRAAVKSRLRRARREFELRMQRYHGTMGGLTLLR